MHESPIRLSDIESSNKILHHILTHVLENEAKVDTLSEKDMSVVNEDKIFKDVDLSPRMASIVKFARK